MEEEEPQYRRGLIASRKNLWIARLAAQRFLACDEKDHDSQMLYGGAFFTFLRSALYALKYSDGQHDTILRDLSDSFFQQKIKSSDVYKTIEAERNGIAHGNDSYAIHPSKPLGLLDRAYAEFQIEWDEIVFEEAWPFPPFKGQPISEVMNTCWRQVSNWLDEIDVAHETAWAQRSK